MTATIVSATVLSDVAGAIAIDVRKTPRASYPPTGANSIVSSSPPSLSGTAQSQDVTLTGWTTSISPDDVLVAVITSVSGITDAVLSLQVTRGA